VNYKKILILLLFIGCMFAQNTDKETNQKSSAYTLYHSFETTYDVLRVKNIDATGAFVTPSYQRYSTSDSLFVATAADTLTTTWDSLGAEIDMRGYTQLNIFVTLDINSGTNPRIRALGKYERGGADEYNFVIETVSASDVKIEDEYLEFNADADQKVIIKVETDGVPFVRLEGYGSLGGGSQYDKIYINKIWK